MISVCDKLSISSNYIPRITTVATNFCYDFTIVLPVDCAIKSGPRGCGKLTYDLFLHYFYIIPLIIIIKWNVLFVEKIIFWWLHRRFKNLRSTTCKHRRKYYGKCDVIYRYLHIELIWRLLMVQYIQNNVIMKWTARFWCAILIAHPIVMTKHGGSCVHFSGISTCGRTSRETVSHPQRQPLPTPYKIFIYPSMLLWQIHGCNP